MIALCTAVEVPDVRNVQDLPKADKKALFFFQSWKGAAVESALCCELWTFINYNFISLEMN